MPKLADTSYDIGRTLTRRILDRLGLDDGHVQVLEQSWDFGGGCTTCSYPESGFQVLVNGEQVWPSKEYLDQHGGVYFADTEGYVEGRKLTVYGMFDKWLNGEALVYDEDTEEDDD